MADNDTTTTQETTTNQTWLLDLKPVAEACAAERDAARGAPEVVDIGPARLDLARSGPTTTAFVVDTGALRLGDQLMTRLAVGPAGAGSKQFPVIEVGSWDRATFRVEAELDPFERASAGMEADGTGLRLYGTINHTYLSHALAERFEQLAEPGLAEGLLAAAGARGNGAGRPLPLEVGVICGPSELRRAILASAIEQLAAAGRSVLVVSSDNVALDAALLAVSKATGELPLGRFLRLGIPTTNEIADDPRLAYAAVLARLSPHLQGRLADTAAELRNLAASAVTAQPELPAGTSAAEPAAVALEPDPIVLAERHTSAATAVQAADIAVARATAAAETASAEHASARQVWRALETARLLHKRIGTLAAQVEQATTASAASAIGVGRLANDDSRAHQLIVAAEVASNRLSHRDLALAELTEAQVEARRQGTSRLTIMAADQALARARTRHAEAERESLRARAERARAGGELQRLDRLTAGHPVVTGRRGQDGGVRRAMETRVAVSGLALTRALDPETAARRAELRASYTSLRNDQTTRGPIAIENAQVVFAPFAQLVANPALAARTFDNVLIERAGSVPAAWVVYAASKATRALTLATSFDESPLSAPLDATLTPLRRRWVANNILSILDMASPAAVAQHPAGMVLAASS